MTWAIDAVLAAVLVGLVWLGAKRGLMKSLAGVISVGAAFFGASWCANRFVTPVIVIGVSGSGQLDLPAYAEFLAGNMADS